MWRCQVRSQGGKIAKEAAQRGWGDRHISKIGSKVGVLSQNQEGRHFLSNAELLRMRMGHVCRSGLRRRPWALPEAPSGGRWGGSQIRSR